MTSQEYFMKLINLAQEGLYQIDRGRRDVICRQRIADMVAAESARAWRNAVFKRTAMKRIALAAAGAGYILAAVMGAAAVAVGVECAIGSMPASLCIGYALGALAALMIGAAAHAVYDDILR